MPAGQARQLWRYGGGGAPHVVARTSSAQVEAAGTLLKVGWTLKERKRIKAVLPNCQSLKINPVAICKYISKQWQSLEIGTYKV